MAIPLMPSEVPNNFLSTISVMTVPITRSMQKLVILPVHSLAVSIAFERNQLFARRIERYIAHMYAGDMAQLFTSEGTFNPVVICNIISEYFVTDEYWGDRNKEGQKQEGAALAS